MPQAVMIVAYEKASCWVVAQQDDWMLCCVQHLSVLQSAFHKGFESSNGFLSYIRAKGSGLNEAYYGFLSSGTVIGVIKHTSFLCSHALRRNKITAARFSDCQSK